MPKPLTMTIEIEEIAFGRVFRTLDGMPGVVAIRPHGSGPKNTPRAKNSRGATTMQLALAALAAGPKSSAELNALFESSGKKASSVPSAIQKLKKQKLLSANGTGNYTITAAGNRALKKEY